MKYPHRYSIREELFRFSSVIGQKRGISIQPISIYIRLAMEAMLKKELGTSMLKYTGYSGGGCISEGQSYDTDNGRVFVKINHKSQVLNFVFVCITCTNAITIKVKV